MRHRPGELARRVARQLRVGVQRNDVLHALQHRRLARDARERVGAAAAQHRVQVGELAALSLVAHPAALAGIPAPRAMEEEEALGAAVLAVECLDAAPGGGGERRVAGQRLRLRVLEIREQREVQALVAVGEEAHLERLEEPGDVRLAREHRRHHDQGA